MKKLLSLPPNLVGCFHEVAGVAPSEYFCTADPIGAKLGSGGGTHWLLKAAYLHDRNERDVAESSDQDFLDWLSSEKRILLHAGGQSRRLPAYAPSGKILTPIPVFRWERGQRIGQNLLQLQLPLYQRIMDNAPEQFHTLIASGDVYIRAGKLQPVPQADIVCYGLWTDTALAKNHGVFFSRRESPGTLDFVLQKPSVEILAQLMHTHLFLMDIGVWLLSDKAVRVLMEKSNQDSSHALSEGIDAGAIKNYDLYSDFGQAMGQTPTHADSEINGLKVVVLPLEGGEFYHYGTSREMISSTLAVQNLVYDQRAIMHLGVKAHPSIFTQNCHNEISFEPTNENTWIENSYVGKGWILTNHNIVTGVPRNDWQVTLSPGQCVDIVPIDDNKWALRPYGFNDAMRGDLRYSSTLYLGIPVTQWLADHHLDPDHIEGSHDIQSARIFPVCNDVGALGLCLEWMLSPQQAGLDQNLVCGYISANEISDRANLRRLQRQRLEFRRENLVAMSRNHRASVFYQTNLEDLAREYHQLDIPMPEPLSPGEPLIKSISDLMFRSRLLELRGEDGGAYGSRAFALLADGLTQSAQSQRQQPTLGVYADQIVWGRSPVRIDLAGGWTDTPPYCLTMGGNVVNIAIELNGQPPLQCYIKPASHHYVLLRSIDLGAMERVQTWEELSDFTKVGSPFSIPKAALCLAGFLPKFCHSQYGSLQEQLKDFGCGIEITLLSAVPAGSGLGTSSILAATVLGALSDFCMLGWDKTEICNRTLVLEQMLTTGGGWQDQYGGVLHGVKLLKTQSGFDQTPEVRYLGDNIYTDEACKSCHLLYYTGITRTAKKILVDIVRGMFLYDTERLALLSEMKEHAIDMYHALLKNDYDRVGQLVGKTWRQNQLLDSGTNPPQVQAIIDKIQDLCYGLKLPGAGGGGFLYIMAKDPTAALRIREILNAEPPNPRARFVEMTLSKTGFQLSRS